MGGCLSAESDKTGAGLSRQSTASMMGDDAAEAAAQLGGKLDITTKNTTKNTTEFSVGYLEMTKFWNGLKVGPFLAHVHASCATAQASAGAYLKRI